MAKPTGRDRPVSLGPLEDEVMRVLWARQQATVREVQEALAAGGRRLAYTTVMTVMVHLAGKHMLARERTGRSFTYRASVSAEEFRESTARVLAQRLVRGFNRLGIASFVNEVASVGPEQLRELQELADQAAADDDSSR
jgi:predicted transcriptional regulator